MKAWTHTWHEKEEVDDGIFVWKRDDPVPLILTRKYFYVGMITSSITFCGNNFPIWVYLSPNVILKLPPAHAGICGFNLYQVG